MKKEYILIDNDLLIRKSWEFAAKKAEVQLTIFSSVEGFLSMAEELDRRSLVYIDLELDNGVMGDVEAQKLSQMGFKSIYLATGHDPKTLNKPNYILEIVGKRSPF